MTPTGGAVVFDLDGTLIDSAPDIRVVANRLLAERGLAELSLAETKRFIGSGTSVFIARLRAARDLPEAEQDPLHAAFVGAYDTAVDLTVIYPGVVPALRALAGQGYALGICTNKPLRPAQSVLRHLGLDRHFSAVLGGDSLPQRKPDPAPLQACFEKLGAEGPRIYVGDSEVDADTAQAAGVPFLLYTLGYRKTEVGQITCAAAFDDFADLPGLVAALA
ncbi:phosphoglycolate phosphatase [Thalassococcus sp. BH17M4-6]|uniref:phosphoglycolate phosphatase n=1 Tax=Thalassococcus sp. BH17M4-6 TaxID=3413148 RepID=UPI003BC0D050